MYRKLLISSLIFILSASSAFADTISHRLGVTGKIGFATPLKDDFINGTSKSDTGFAGGGGLIYGFSDHLAAEFDVIHLPKLDVSNGSTKAYEAKLTDFSLGLQYRFMSDEKFVPYVGAGADFMKGTLTHVNGNTYDLDWTYGGHLNAGLDWFLTKGVALSAEVRGVLATSGDVLTGSTKVSEYDPFWVQGTLGIRLFLPKEF